MKDINDLLQNYHNLVGKVDSLCGGVMTHCADSISCRKGCDSCCRHFSIFWVEAVNLAGFLATLPRNQAALLRSKAEARADQDVCPLLLDGACAVYASRPIICRTHGLPILTRSETGRSVDFCPKNFTQVDAIPGHLVIDLDTLNKTLVAINALFVSRYFGGNPPPTERLTIADALFLQI